LEGRRRRGWQLPVFNDGLGVLPDEGKGPISAHNGFGFKNGRGKSWTGGPSVVAVGSYEMDEIQTQETADGFCGKSPVPSFKAPGVGLGEGAHPDELIEEAGIPAEHGVPLRVGYDGRDPITYEFKEKVLDPGKDVLRRELHKEVRAPVEDKAFPVDPDLGDQVVGDVNLGPGEDLDGNDVLLQGPVQLITFSADRPWILECVVAAEDVRGGDNRHDTIGRRQPGHGQRLIHSLRAIIQAREDMTMEIDETLRRGG